MSHGVNWKTAWELHDGRCRFLPNGAPSELTTRRYVREAIGGSSVIWFEAISIVKEGRSSAHQLMLTEENLEEYKEFTEKIKEAGRKANGFAPYLIMQANHSGRYSNPMENRLPSLLIVIRSMKSCVKQMIPVSLQTIT